VRKHRNAFDAVYGSSAGAINATYFLSGQKNGVHIYTEEIANEDFIDLRRLFRSRQGVLSLLDDTMRSRARVLHLVSKTLAVGPF
jgi:predicted patatin/cPLA2 family phospholipase